MLVDSELKHPFNCLDDIKKNLTFLKNLSDGKKFNDVLESAGYCFIILWFIIRNYYSQFENWNNNKTKCNLTNVEYLINIELKDILHMLEIYSHSESFTKIPIKKHRQFSKDYKKTIRDMEQLIQNYIFKTEIYEFTLKGTHSFVEFVNYLKNKIPEVVQKYLLIL